MVIQKIGGRLKKPLTLVGRRANKIERLPKKLLIVKGGKDYG